MASSVAIKAIEASTIHQIQSGQVIVDLCSVAKELVENSLDAGATSIDVRFKNQGLDAIEVQDNGYGIASQNYETLALKHYTSKLSTYADLTTLQTFGFRGEALSSLCALSRFSVVTCTKDEAPKAKKLEFEASGKLKSTSIVSGQKGTTVFVEDLFYNLPVRRRELERNIKREWGKVINLLNQYACVQTGVKFSVSQQPTKGKRMLLFSTKGNQTTRENLINVFGVKTLAALIPLELKLELVPTHNPLHKRKTSGDDDDGTREIRVRGHVSRPAHGEGRQTPDRQMFYVNGRPCALPQFAKVFNEVYRSYNASQSPFIFADIQLDTHLYDVNVSPDKRTILLHDQGQMLDNLRESLVELFEKQDVTVPVSQLQTPFKKPGLPRQSTTLSDSAKSVRQSPLRGFLASTDKPEGSLEREEEDSAGADDVSDGAEYETPRPKRTTASGRQGPDTAQDLISRWVERRTGATETRKAAAGPVGPIITARQKLLDDLEKNDEKTRSDKETSPATDEEAEQARQHVATLAANDNEDVNLFAGRDESPIPSLPPPTQLPRPTLPTTTVRSPQRPGQHVATIRIDDETITGIIGSRPKRPRTDSGPGPGKQASKPRAPLPSFGGRLSQMFAAAGASQLPSAQDGDLGSDGESEQDEEEVGSGNRREDDDDEELFVSQDEPEAPPMEDEEEEQDPVLGDYERAEADSERLDRDMVDDEAEQGDEISKAASDQSDQEEDGDYSNEEDRPAQGDPEGHEVVHVVEIGAEPSEETLKRQRMLLKGGAKRKDTTAQLLQHLKTNEQSLRRQMKTWRDSMASFSSRSELEDGGGPGLETDDAEEKLSLKISKSDFGKMKIIGQFNLGFIIAVREAEESARDSPDGAQDDELFIIDQHASDEKFNFERLQATTTVQSQRLVQPKTLELTAMEEEIIMENTAALETNGFQVAVDQTGEAPVGSRIRLLSLPLSRETTFSLADLEELVFLLGDNPSASATTVPRPGRVRKMFAMRACRSSIMIGKALSGPQMKKVVAHMGEMEKPWNCPHGRPTMRHLCGLGAWDRSAWREGDGEDGARAETDWGAWVRERQ